MNLILDYPYNLSSNATYNAMLGRVEPVTIAVSVCSIYGLNIRNVVSVMNTLLI
jgi:hypothetical protein